MKPRNDKPARDCRLAELGMIRERRDGGPVKYVTSDPDDPEREARIVAHAKRIGATLRELHATARQAAERQKWVKAKQRECDRRRKASIRRGIES